MTATDQTSVRTTTGHIAGIVGVSVATIRRWCDAGMDHGMIGTWRAVSVEDVARWLSLHRAYCNDGNLSVASRENLNALADWYVRKVGRDQLNPRQEAA